MNNLDRWNRAKFTRSSQINAQAAKIEANRSRYEAVSAKTGVPWDVIGVIHYRESSGSFSGVLHNGQKIIGTGKKTTIVPKGRGPFSTWEDAAVDALMNCHPYAGKNKDWSIAGTLDILERYNGLGYRRKGRPSPYLWAGTDQYVKGKYVADGKYDPNHVDKQLGVAPILMKIRERKATAPVPVPKPSPEPALGRTDTVTVRVVQERLKDLGYSEVGKPDGIKGKLTRTAILAFKNENDLHPINDVIDQGFLNALDTAAPRMLPRETVSPEVVRENAPEVRTNWMIKIGALIAGIPAALGGLVDGVFDNLGFARETIKPLKEMFSDIPSEVWLIGVAVIAGSAYLVARQGEQKGIEAYKAGERR